MRLGVLERGHPFGTKVLFAMIRAFSGQPVLDVVRLAKYRPDFYGDPMQAVTQEVMRGPSSWSVGDRELMAALVAKTNGSEWCIRAHSAVANRAYGDETKVAAVLADLDTAPIEEPLRATLRLLRKLTRERSVDANDVRAVLASGASRAQIADALAVGFAFNVIARLADAFGFHQPGPEAFAAGAKYLLTRGYR
ncbi:MAG TPA: carboxymuconolactone decarboxylase family protein [Myxococcales bacterium]|nr:carboxymuconolactone decarboxylase family protein [Myxococcales bacterium]